MSTFAQRMQDAQREDPLGTLERYASTPNPELLDKNVLHSFTDKTITIKDAFPKSKYHMLILPRPRVGLPVQDLRNLKTLMAGDKERARKVLAELGEEAQRLIPQVEAEMIKDWGFKWEIWTGFHALPSMRHIHLHVMSADLCSPSLKNKKHYNTFHPKVGFFLPYKDVMDWFDTTPSYYEMMRQFHKSTYEHLLQDDLVCFKCRRDFKYMPRLKEHLDEEFDRMRARELESMQRKKQFRERMEKKRKRDEERAAAAAADAGSASASASKDTPPPAPAEDAPTSSPPAKRQATQESIEGH